MEAKVKKRIEVVSLEVGNKYGLPTGQYEFLFFNHRRETL